MLFQNGGTDAVSNPRRTARRKSSGKLFTEEMGSTAKQSKTVKQSKDKEEEERSATKIQAGVRGFLVRRRQQKSNKYSN